MLLDNDQSQHLQTEIAQLEARLHDLRAQLDVSQYPSPPASHPDQKTPWTMPSGEHFTLGV
jgi:urease accessory protein